MRLKKAFVSVILAIPLVFGSIAAPASVAFADDGGVEIDLDSGGDSVSSPPLDGKGTEDDHKTKVKEDQKSESEYRKEVKKFQEEAKTQKIDETVGNVSAGNLKGAGKAQKGSNNIGVANKKTSEKAKESLRDDTLSRMVSPKLRNNYPGDGSGVCTVDKPTVDSFILGGGFATEGDWGNRGGNSNCSEGGCTYLVKWHQKSFKVDVQYNYNNKSCPPMSKASSLGGGTETYKPIAQQELKLIGKEGQGNEISRTITVPSKAVSHDVMGKITCGDGSIVKIRTGVNRDRAKELCHGSEPHITQPSSYKTFHHPEGFEEKAVEKSGYNTLVHCPGGSVPSSEIGAGFIGSNPTIGGSAVPMNKNLENINSWYSGGKGEISKDSSPNGMLNQFQNGCAYKAEVTRIKFSELFNARANQLCVWDVKYGVGKTHAGTVWNSQSFHYDTPYKKNPTFGGCVGTFKMTIPPTKSAPELLPKNIMGRYSNTVRWTLDDPYLDVSSCDPLPNGTCKAESIKVVGHNFIPRSRTFELRNTCAITGGFSKIETVSGTAGQTGGALSNPNRDIAPNGQKLTYTMSDCVSPAVNVNERYTCRVGELFSDVNDPEAKGANASVQSSSTIPSGSAFNGYTPKDAVTNGEERPNLNNRGELKDRYNTPTQGNMPVEIKKTTGGNSKPDGAEASSQRDSTLKNGMSITRSGEPKYFSFPKPRVDVSRGGYNLGGASNLRTTDMMLLVHKDGTPLVNTPQSREHWKIDGNKGPVSNSMTKVKTPWLPDSIGPGDAPDTVKRYNKYFTGAGTGEGDALVSQYADSSQLDLRVHSPKDGKVIKGVIGAGQTGTSLYNRFDDYIVYRLGFPATSIGFSSPWLSENNKPNYVAPAYEVTGNFPVWAKVLTSVKPYGKPKFSIQTTTMKNQQLLCIGAETPLSSYKPIG